MNEYIVTILYKNENYRPWRQRRSQGIHNAAGNVQFVNAKDQEDAVRIVSLRDPFTFAQSRTYMAVPMRSAKFFEADIPSVNVIPSGPE